MQIPRHKRTLWHKIVQQLRKTCCHSHQHTPSTLSNSIYTSVKGLGGAMWYQVRVFEHFRAYRNMGKNQHKLTVESERMHETRQTASGSLIHVPDRLCTHTNRHISGLRVTWNGFSSFFACSRTQQNKHKTDTKTDRLKRRMAKRMTKFAHGSSYALSPLRTQKMHISIVLSGSSNTN